MELDILRDITITDYFLIVGILICCIFTCYVLDCLLRLPYVKRYDAKRILITGCDSGFGYEFAQRLDKLGCQVFAACLTRKGKEDVAKKCKNVLAFEMDVSCPKSVKAGYEFVCSKLPSEEGMFLLYVKKTPHQL